MPSAGGSRARRVGRCRAAAHRASPRRCPTTRRAPRRASAPGGGPARHRRATSRRARPSQRQHAGAAQRRLAGARVAADDDERLGAHAIDQLADLAAAAEEQRRVRRLERRQPAVRIAVGHAGVAPRRRRALLERDAAAHRPTRTAPPASRSTRRSTIARERRVDAGRDLAEPRRVALLHDARRAPRSGSRGGAPRRRAARRAGCRASRGRSGGSPARRARARAPCRAACRRCTRRHAGCDRSPPPAVYVRLAGRPPRGGDSSRRSPRACGARARSRSRGGSAGVVGGVPSITLARPKSSSLAWPSSVEHRVGRLDVAVEHAAAMRGGEPARQVERDVEHLPRRHRPLELVERAARARTRRPGTGGRRPRRRDRSRRRWGAAAARSRAPRRRTARAPPDPRRRARTSPRPARSSSESCAR